MGNKFKFGEEVRIKLGVYEVQIGKICSDAIITRQGNRVYYGVSGVSRYVIYFFEEDMEQFNRDWGDGE